MIVLDTHAWLWWIRSDGRLGEGARQAIADATTIFIPAICCWEVGMLATKGRLGFVAGEGVESFVRQALSHSRVRAVPVTPDIAVRAALLTLEHADPADRLVIASAIELGVPLATRDSAVTGAEVAGLRTLW